MYNHNNSNANYGNYYQGQAYGNGHTPQSYAPNSTPQGYTPQNFSGGQPPSTFAGPSPQSYPPNPQQSPQGYQGNMGHNPQTYQVSTKVILKIIQIFEMTVLYSNFVKLRLNNIFYRSVNNSIKYNLIKLCIFSLGGNRSVTSRLPS